MTLSLQFQVKSPEDSQQRLTFALYKVKNHRDPKSIYRGMQENSRVFISMQMREFVFVCLDDCVFSLADFD